MDATLGVGMRTMLAGGVSADLASLLSANLLRSVYQPIVCLDRLAPVGVEALVRGPAGTRWESPAALFGAAAREGRVAALDWASRRTALQGVLAAGLCGPAHLFLNAEPEGLGSTAFPGFDAVADAVAARGVQVVLEITERSLTRHPAELLRTVQRVREMGWKLAIDDVGAERASLALMPFLAPDIIKLDLRLIQARTTVEIAEIVNAVLAHSERTGAAVLAEGIETEQHLDLARSMGARLGQGWYFGLPGELRAPEPYVPMILTTTSPPSTAATPWDTVRGHPGLRTAAKPLLVATSKTLERHALVSGDACVILGAFQRAQFFTRGTARRYAGLGESAAFVAAIGADMPDRPAPSVRGVAIDERDPLVREWDVAVVGPHFAGALIAREHPGNRPDQERLFDYLLTYDRERVLTVARSLMGYVDQAAVPGR